ncbi:MAG TPA: putative ABC exporter domain-containing protein [Planctomycetota bacterium]
MFLSSWWYYQRCVVRNRVKALLRRMRQPKYVIGFVLTSVYLGWILLLNPGRSGEDARSPEQVRADAGVVAAGFYWLQVVVAWFSLSSGRGVAFREAEVQLLFPRPFTRWQILRFKWLSAQPGGIVGSLIVGLVFHRLGGLSYPCVVLGFWINQAVFYANATLVGLWLARLKARGGRAARCTSLPAWTLLCALLAGLALAWPSIGNASGWDAVQALARSPWLAALSWPFLQMTDLLLSTDFASFAAASLVPLLFFAAHVCLVWWADFRFEDQAVEIAEKIQNIKTEGLGALQSKRELVVAKPRVPWQLAPTGPVWKALVWKNIISLGRLPRRLAIRFAIFLVLIVSLVGSLVVTEGTAPDAPTRIGFVLLGLLVYATLLAPSMVRVDLRIDIPHFDVLKAMPLRGRSLIFGEIMGTVVVIWLVQAVGCLLAAILITREGKQEFVWSDKAPALVGLLCVFFAIDFALVAIENLSALWLPGFVRLGRGVRTGFDNIGQNLIGALIRMVVLFALLLAPGITGAMLGALAHTFGLGQVPSIALGAVVFAALLFAETLLSIHLSEARYARFDITSENITGDQD